MTYKVIGDSYLDLTDELEKNPRFQMIPLISQIGNTLVVGDETSNRKKFIDLVKARPEHPRTACPSPETFKEVYGETDIEGVSVIILSGHLSGSYSSAELTRKLFKEEWVKRGHGDQEEKAVVIDLSSVSSGELNITMYIQALYEASLEFDQVLEKTLTYRDSMKTYFVLESLDTLRENGRLSGPQTFFATALSIKPVMGADSGTITKLDQARGINKAIQRTRDIAVKEAEDTVNKITVVCYVNYPQWAEYMKSKLEKRGTFKDVVITIAVGAVTVYADDDGVILAI